MATIQWKKLKNSVTWSYFYNTSYLDRIELDLIILLWHWAAVLMCYQCKPEQVTWVLTFIISSRSIRVRRGVVKESKDVLREVFTFSTCPLTLSCCFFKKEQGRDKEVALEKVSGRVVSIDSLSLHQERSGFPAQAHHLTAVCLWGILPTRCSIFSFMM